ncbi:2,3-bisphosphoglycerate-independent phosphoglycerate mutase 1 [Metallosphaera sp. J1]|uniref:2,3-bisphosphoglycerate-independent phosphoglycerate mutase n=1 Tax=Metallosphaera TaxID=41980 RepID=UPI001EDD4A8C|nr:2,3-bisphosphoglycerate-independent phosphoglycerate mutase [Metallosphaera javensis (ex Hofmann et al. 2022)]MCG3107922.1 2,3-bisphosphoglycerate-independent phosphoglycerate mutase 1 [Metallosphaera javensis (ex Hofmann et al. 2022)]BCS91922.1 MAG: 2,3-bisphosphoglycerate-independent phosphoglycerate mutase 1 [Metallosphaera javensis (ex Sakai et al. 2022)]
MNRYKILLVVGDGLGDRQVTALGGKTPLEKADKPTIASLLHSSLVGLMDPIGPGVVPGSDTSHLAIFGLDPRKYYKGRGSFEALGAGAVLNEGDVAFRGNFATVDSNLVVTDRRAGRKIDEADDLVRELNDKIHEIDGVKVRFYHGTEHRVSVVLSGENLSDKISDTDPHEVGKRVLFSEPLDDSLNSKRTANVINTLTRRIYEVLSTSPLNERRAKEGLPPANIILLRGASIHSELPKLRDYTGLSGAAVSATALIKGVCKSLGMDVVTPPGATGGIDTDYMAKAEAAAKLLEDHDLVFLHIKATDAASHDGKISEKVRAIEMIDRSIGRVLDRYGSELVILFTGDHATPVELKEHSGDPVPVLLYVPTNIIPDNVEDFNERQGRKGSLRIVGLNIIDLLLNYSNRATKYGA